MANLPLFPEEPADLWQRAGKPLFKWPGGKRWIRSSVEPFIPRSYNRFVEPFCGGAALFFALRPFRATLADSNPDLVNTYRQVRDNVEAVIDVLSTWSNSEEAYYEIRKSREVIPARAAARFLYLTRLSFNGIYRENLHGVYNVPYGRKTHLEPCDPKHLRQCAIALGMATLKCQDFKATFKLVQTGDLVYVDPPYTIAHNNNGFIKYNQKLFSWEDQIELANCCRRAAEAGAKVVVSNADHGPLRELYAGFKYLQVKRHSKISASSKSRSLISEALFLS